MYLVRWKDWEKGMLALENDMEGGREVIKEWDTAHAAPVDHNLRHPVGSQKPPVDVIFRKLLRKEKIDNQLDRHGKHLEMQEPPRTS
jgi:hypothetical protein